METPPPTVEQIDREAAFALTGYEPMAYGMSDLSDAVQAFARHRLASTAELEREIAALRGAGAKALNYITNTEGELGITLDCGDALRNALGGQP